MEIIKMPKSDELDCCFISGATAGTGFTAISLIFQKGEDFYEFNNILVEASKPVNKKPTGPGKEKAALAFKKLQEETKNYLVFSDLVAAKIESKKHGVFVMVSYEKCPVDVIEYLIRERN